MKLAIETPPEFLGAIKGHLSRKRGVVTSTEIVDETCTITAEAPLAELFDFSNEIRSMTRGQGNFGMEPLMYRQVH